MDSFIIAVATKYVPYIILNCYEGMGGKESDREKREIKVAYLDHLWRFVKIEMPGIYLIPQ